jgi:hypothetical protein
MAEVLSLFAQLSLPALPWLLGPVRFERGQDVDRTAAVIVAPLPEGIGRICIDLLFLRHCTNERTEAQILFVVKFPKCALSKLSRFYRKWFSVSGRCCA